MKKIRISKLCFLLTFLISICNISYATGNVLLNSEKSIVQKGEIFTISVDIEKISVSALIINLNFDSEKIECVECPERTNIIGNTITFLWYDETGGENPKIDEEIAIFTFRAKEVGKANFGIKGTLYDSNENELPVFFSNTEVNIQDENINNGVPQADVDTDIVIDNNSYLKSMRLNIEGISPDFNKEINEYVIIIDSSISNLEVEAIPENKDAIVQVMGNTKLENGLNTININVTSKDGKNRRIYTIHVTKTENMQIADPNLENLAIEYANIYPEFDSNIIQYSADIPSDIVNLKILAVPKNPNATVQISGDKNLKMGNNTVSITVIGEDNVTKKVYTVNLYKMTKTEEKQKKEEEIEELQKSHELIQRTGLLQQQEKKRLEIGNKSKHIVLFAIAGVVTTLIIIYFIIKKRKQN